MPQPNAGASEALPMDAPSFVALLQDAQLQHPERTQDPEGIMGVYDGTVDTNTIAPSSTSTSTSTSTFTSSGAGSPPRKKHANQHAALNLTLDSKSFHDRKRNRESAKQRRVDAKERLKERIPFLERELAEAQTALTDRAAEWDVVRARLKEECDTISKALSELQKGTAAARVKSLEGKLRRSEQKVIDAHKELEVQRGVTVDLRGQLTTYKHEVESLRAARLLLGHPWPKIKLQGGICALYI